jgi:hypothetical protein
MRPADKLTLDGDDIVNVERTERDERADRDAERAERGERADRENDRVERHERRRGAMDVRSRE